MTLTQCGVFQDSIGCPVQRCLGKEMCAGWAVKGNSELPFPRGSWRPVTGSFVVLNVLFP